MSVSFLEVVNILSSFLNCVGFSFLKKVCISALKKEGVFSLYVGSGLHPPDSNRTGTSVCGLEGQNRGHFTPQNYHTR